MKTSPLFLKLMIAGLGLAALPILFWQGLWPLVVVGQMVLFLAALWDALTLYRIEISLTPTLPPSIGVGDTLPCRLRIRFKSFTDIETLIRPEVRKPLEPGEDTLTRLRTGVQNLEISLHAPRRGTGMLKTLWCRFSGPTGLVYRIVQIPIKHPSIAVVPNIPYVRKLAVEHFGTWRFRGGVRLTRHRGAGSEFDALEAYVPGMDLRHADWKASAKHQALRIRRFRVEQNQRVVLSIDSGRLMADAIDGMQRLDHAIHAALLLSYFALRDGDHVGLHAYGPEPEFWIPPNGGLRHHQTLLTACSNLQTRDAETNHVLGIQDLLSRIGRRTLVVVITEFSDS
ncbi:MAG: DUF58 domain-containing protein, partial [Planctomycetes bacterium]|nr:DUF58 domain-containing protein [Planctomycetota bacterium]